MLRDARCASKTGERALFGALTVLGVAAFAMPGLVLRIAPPCLFDLLGFEHCWGCGMTHAVIALLHARFAAAWNANPRAYIVLPLLLAEYARFGWRSFGAVWLQPIALMP